MTRDRRMSRRRRYLLKSLGVACLPVPHVAAAAIGTGSHRQAFPHTLRVLVDTLIPADETPAASALGIDRELLGAAARATDYRRLLEQGAEWLDATARALGARSFAAAADAQRTDAIRLAERAAAGSLPREFLEQVLADALRLYYTHPATWRPLGYSGPPQPAGFPDFEHPPARRR